MCIRDRHIREQRVDSGPGWDRVARCAAAVPVGIALPSYLYVMF